MPGHAYAPGPAGAPAVARRAPVGVRRGATCSSTRPTTSPGCRTGGEPAVSPGRSSGQQDQPVEPHRRAGGRHPHGFSSAEHMPLSMQSVAAPGDDAEALLVADAFQLATDFHTARRRSSDDADPPRHGRRAVRACSGTGSAGGSRRPGWAASDDRLWHRPPFGAGATGQGRRDAGRPAPPRSSARRARSCVHRRRAGYMTELCPRESAPRDLRPAHRQVAAGSVRRRGGVGGLDRAVDSAPTSCGDEPRRLR